MLELVESEVGELSGLRMTEDTEDTALVMKPVCCWIVHLRFSRFLMEPECDRKIVLRMIGKR